MSNEIILRQENVELVMRQAPQAFRENKLSHDNCLNACQALLDTIEGEGMSDELDQKADVFIRKSRNTVKKMYEKRNAVTKLFDEIRTVFTTMENDIDPSKAGSVPARLQTMRNDYAKKKREEAERKRLEEEARIRRENAVKAYRQQVEADYLDSFNRYINGTLNRINALNQSVTLDNYTQVEQSLRAFPLSLPDEFLKGLHSSVLIPAGLDTQEAEAICRDIWHTLESRFREQYNFEIADNVADSLAMLPSKKRELEAIAQSSAEEAARRAEELKRRDAEEAARREQERIRREAEERQRQQVQKQQAEMAGLFEQAKVATPTYQPKLTVKKKIVITSPLGFLDIINLWWSTEGCNLSVDELAKKFKTQVTHCEKLANDKASPRFIQSDYIRYEDDIKAK